MSTPVPVYWRLAYNSTNLRDTDLPPPQRGMAGADVLLSVSQNCTDLPQSSEEHKDINERELIFR